MNTIAEPEITASVSALRYDATRLVTLLKHYHHSDQADPVALILSSIALAGESIREAYTVSPNKVDLDEAEEVCAIVAEQLYAATRKAPPSHEQTPAPASDPDPEALPHSPRHDAASLRGEFNALSNTTCRSPHEKVLIALSASTALIHENAVPFPPDIFYNRVCETLGHAIYYNPLNRDNVVPRKRFWLTPRVCGAGNALFTLASKQIKAAQKGKAHPQAVVAALGAFFGEKVTAAIKATDDASIYPQDIDDFLSHALRRFEEECTADEKGALRPFDFYLENTQNSMGRAPYPQSTVNPENRPPIMPAALATFLREPAKQLAKKADLSKWELANAAAAASLFAIRAASKDITAPVAISLTMEQATAAAFVRPFDLEAFVADSPKPVRVGLHVLRQRITAVPLPF